MRACKWLIGLFGCTLASAAVAADDILSAAALGAGGTSIADRERNDGVSTNPSVAAILPRYDLAGTAGLSLGGWEAAATVVDSRQSAVTIGLAYRRRQQSPPITIADLPGWIAEGETVTNRRRYHEIGFALAVPMIGRRLALGVGGGLALTDHDRRPKGSTFDLDAGLTWAPTGGITVGLVARDLAPMPEADAPVAMVGGVRFDDESLGAIAVELEQRLIASRSTAWRIGAERPIGPVDLRVGGRNEHGERAVTFGVGAHNLEGAFDVGVVLPLGGSLAWNEVTVVAGLHVRTRAGDANEPE
jgi:hypothetical protein